MGFTGFASGLIGFDSSGFGFEPGIGRARVRYIYFFLVWFFVSFCCFVIFRSAGREEKKKPVVGRRATANRNEKKKKGPAAFLTGLLFSFSCSSLLLPESLAAMVFFHFFFEGGYWKSPRPNPPPFSDFPWTRLVFSSLIFSLFFPQKKTEGTSKRKLNKKETVRTLCRVSFFLLL